MPEYLKNKIFNIKNHPKFKKLTLNGALKYINILFFIVLAYSFSTSVYENKMQRYQKEEAFHLKYLGRLLIDFNSKCGFLPASIHDLQNNTLCSAMPLDYWDFVDVYAQPVFYKKTKDAFYLAFYTNTMLRKNTNCLRDGPAPIKIDLSTGTITDFKDLKYLRFLMK